MELSAGIYKTTKGNTIVMAEDGRNLYALWDGKVLGNRTKWPPKYATFKDFADSQKMVRTKDWNGLFF